MQQPSPRCAYRKRSRRVRGRCTRASLDPAAGADGITIGHGWMARGGMFGPDLMAKHQRDWCRCPQRRRATKVGRLAGPRREAAGHAPLAPSLDWLGQPGAMLSLEAMLARWIGAHAWTTGAWRNCPRRNATDSTPRRRGPGSRCTGYLRTSGTLAVALRRNGPGLEFEQSRTTARSATALLTSSAHSPMWTLLAAAPCVAEVRDGDICPYCIGTADILAGRRSAR